MHTYGPNVNPEHKYNKYQYMDICIWFQSQYIPTSSKCLTITLKDNIGS